MTIRKNILKLALGALAVAISCSSTTATAGFIFDFEFDSVQPGIPNTVIGTIEFSTDNSDNGGDVTLNYTGSIFTHVDTDWVLDTARWDFTDSTPGFNPVYDVVTSWTVPGTKICTLCSDDAFLFAWDPSDSPTDNIFRPDELFFSKDGGILANATFIGPTAVPEPSMLSLLGAGMLVAGFGTAQRRKRTVLQDLA